MKNFFYTIFIILIFSGCSTSKIQTSKYFPNLTKDQVLDASKELFYKKDSERYIIDSYRDRLEVTKIGVVFNTLVHEDYLLKVKEDECGVVATLDIVGSFDHHKILSYEKQTKSFWSSLEVLLDTNDTNITLLKDTKECYIKDEFKNQPIDNQIKNFKEVIDEEF